MYDVPKPKNHHSSTSMRPWNYVNTSMELRQYVHGTTSIRPWNHVNTSMEPRQYVHGTTSIRPWNYVNTSMEPRQYVHGTTSIRPWKPSISSFSTRQTVIRKCKHQGRGSRGGGKGAIPPPHTHTHLLSQGAGQACAPPPPISAISTVLPPPPMLFARLYKTAPIWQWQMSMVSAQTLSFGSLKISTIHFEVWEVHIYITSTRHCFVRPPPTPLWGACMGRSRFTCDAKVSLQRGGGVRWELPSNRPLLIYWKRTSDLRTRKDTTQGSDQSHAFLLGGAAHIVAHADSSMVTLYTRGLKEAIDLPERVTLDQDLVLTNSMSPVNSAPCGHREKHASQLDPTFARIWCNLWEWHVWSFHVWEVF